MANRHTPGPWMWWASCSWRRLGTEDQSTTIMEPVTQCDGYPDLYFRNGGYRGPDASLIAAAPDLLAACEAVVAELEYTRVADMVRAAIAKAHGRKEAEGTGE